MSVLERSGGARGRAPDCTRCTHFSLTWRTPFSHACRAYAFAAATYPSLVVERETGRPCELFERREPPRSRLRDGRGGPPGRPPGGGESGRLG